MWELLEEIMFAYLLLLCIGFDWVKLDPFYLVFWSWIINHMAEIEMRAVGDPNGLVWFLKKSGKRTILRPICGKWITGTTTSW